MKNAFPVVGIGCSAGGLDALRALFGGMPCDGGLAFIVMSHLDPTRVSHLSELLGHTTQMPVAQIEGPVAIEPNHVYVVAPDQDLIVRKGTIHPQRPMMPRGHRHPIDSFFRSLAEDVGERAIAIVLSGTGTNGTLGLRFIKAEGGVAIAQLPETAAFADMPRSAIGAGIVDLVLPPDQMPDALTAIARHTFVRQPSEANTETRAHEDLNSVLAVVRKKTKRDFTSYKTPTLLRRIHRRMGLHRIERLPDYIERLRNNPQEVEALAGDLTINVTGFFRDPEAWEELDEKVIAPLVQSRPDGGTIRVWVPGCSTGEEAYSIAMLVATRMEAARKRLTLRVFATDVAEAMLSSARAGLYPGSIANDIGADRLARYFEVEDDSYRIRKSLREMITFAPQSLLQDPPFSRMDLISCRNLLIYLKPETQRDVLRLLHFALRDDGYLFLGSAETVSGHSDLFATVSKKARIFRRVGPTRYSQIDIPLVPTGSTGGGTDTDTMTRPIVPPLRASELVDRTLLARYAPASALIDRDYRVHYLRGPTGDYLQPASGEPSHNLIAMAREGLELPLRRAVRAAVETNNEVTVDARVRRSSTSHPVQVVVTPLRPEPHGVDRLLVSFFDREAPPAALSSANTVETGVTESELQAELERTREDLRLTLQQMEASNEELKASNEEIRSINEELRASNEELETSKEELQSLNEELHTVNHQLHAKVGELEARTNDLNNLLNSTEIATLFLDRDLCIRWFTPATKELLALRATDIGRPAKHFAPRFREGDLIGDARRVIANLLPIETEAVTDDGRWYMRRIIPYRTGDDRIDGVVVTFINISERRQREHDVQVARQYAESIVDTVPDPLLVLTPDLTVQSANEPFYREFQVKQEDTVGRPIFELGNRQWDIPDLRRLLLEILPQQNEIRDFEVTHEFEQIGRRTMLLNGRRLDHVQLILLAIEDITERKAAEERRMLLTRELSHRVKNTLAVVQAVAHLTMRGVVGSEVVDGFEERLAALAKAHDLLVRNEWRGASLDTLIREQLAPYLVNGAKQVSLSGPAVILPPDIATPLGLMLHELATNAGKYGALTIPSGTVRLSWEMRNSDGNARALELNWTERGGPMVKQPDRLGAGLQLINHSVPDAAVRCDFAAAGLICTIHVPLNGATQS